MTVTLADIEAVVDLVDEAAIPTPMEESRWLQAIVGGQVLLKCENLQRTGSFKIRGAYVRLSRLSAEERARGVVAASAGNHAQGVALAARMLGIKTTVFMPEGAPIPKANATRGYGAEVLFHGRVPHARAGGRPGVLRAHRGRVHPPLRPPRHRGRPGHRRAGDPRPGARGHDRAHPDRWRGADRRCRHRDQVAASRHPRRRRAGRGGRRLPRVPAPGRPRRAGADDDDGRRHRGRSARATSPSPPSSSTSTTWSPSPRSRCHRRWCCCSSAPRWWWSRPARPPSRR